MINWSLGGAQSLPKRDIPSIRKLTPFRNPTCRAHGMTTALLTAHRD
jgi:hypothetical protein